MAKLAIRGHETRGREVIELLEMLGGKNTKAYAGHGYYAYYYIRNLEINLDLDYKQHLLNNVICFTLEEFLEKFPYKVGDKVLVQGMPKTIKGMTWNADSNEMLYKVETNVRGFTEEYHVFAYDIQPYKEEAMEERQYKELRMPLDDDDKLATEVTIDGNKITPPANYLIGKITKVDNGMLVEFVKKQPQYPKTYEECWYMLKHNINNDKVTGYKNNILSSLQKLLICRDAYWKIAGDWKFDFDSEAFYLCNEYKEVKEFSGICDCNAVLAFPTKEMRDAFFENFKDLINVCKELL